MFSVSRRKRRHYSTPPGCNLAVLLDSWLLLDSASAVILLRPMAASLMTDCHWGSEGRGRVEGRKTRNRNHCGCLPDISLPNPRSQVWEWNVDHGEPSKHQNCYHNNMFQFSWTPGRIWEREIGSFHAQTSDLAFSYVVTTWL